MSVIDEKHALHSEYCHSVIISDDRYEKCFKSSLHEYKSTCQATWAKLYYCSSTSLDGLLGEKEGGTGPVRVMGVSGKWFWEGAREAFIR